MVLDERNAIKYINRKRYPLILGGSLCILALVTIGLLFLAGKYDLMISVAGIELLLYMILNCVSGLIVLKIKPYFKVTVVVFIVNFFLIFGFIYLLIGSRLSEYRDYAPILEAFIFSFFGSFILVMIIRNVVTFLKE